MNEESPLSARKGKIARLPAPIREEVCQRLFNGEPGSKILSWLHELPDVLRVLDEHFHEEPISPQNLSEWRKGGYQEWMDRRERVQHIKNLSDYSLKLAQAGGGTLTEGAAAIAGGKILEALEGASQNETEKVIKALVALRFTDVERSKVQIAEKKLEQRDRQLALQEKVFQRTTCELFLKWFNDEAARRIVESKSAKSVKMDQLMLVMFGQKPQEPPSSANDVSGNSKSSEDGEAA